MALTLAVRAPAPITFEEYIEYVRREVDPDDSDSVQASAEKLQGLSQNKQLLLDMMHRELTAAVAKEDSKFYTAHSFVLGSANGMTVRGNIWPKVDSFQNVSHRRAHINKVYAYEYPHDHNFNFLTVGWFGPGYITDVYEYDYEDVGGCDGEKVSLKFLERTHLSDGKVMFFREGRDVHIQYPPPEVSVSLNLLVRTSRTSAREQFIFDIAEQKIRSMATGSDVARTVLAIEFATMLGNQATVEVLNRLVGSSRSGRVRAAAMKAMLTLDPGSRDAIARMASLGCSPHARLVLDSAGV